MIDVSGIVGSTLGSADRTAAKLADDFDNFLTLLTTQLQLQDPLDPMDSNEFTNQLIQFTSIEQSVQQNKNLENLTALTLYNGINASVSFIGKDVTVEQDNANLINGQANWIYELTGNTEQTTLEVYDASDKLVYSQEGEHGAGSHGFNWTGINQLGDQLQDGTYRLKVRTRDVNDAEVSTFTYVRATVDAVDVSGGEPILEAGGFQIPLVDVLAVQPQRQQAGN